jgi:FkbM family methyltransferase
MDELWMIDLFKKLELNSTDQLLDVGANVGQTLLKWKSVYPQNGYIGVEPIPACRYYLETISGLNNFKDCKFSHKALFNSTGRKNLNFHYNDNTDRTATVVESELKPIKSIDVDLVDFPTFVIEEKIQLDKIKIVKIDTEGSEVQILKSMLDFILEYKPKIIVEVLAYNDSTQQRVDNFNALLKELPYSIYRINKKSRYLDKLEKIKTISIPTKVDDSDYLLEPILD